MKEQEQAMKRLGSLALVGFALVAVISVLAQGGRAQDAQERRLRERVAELVEQLDAADREAREAAQAALIELGPAAMPFLPAPDDPRLSAEQQDRLRRVIAALESKRRAAILAPSRISLPRGRYKLDDVLRRLEESTGNRIHDLRAELGQPVENPTIELAWDNVPFWSALLELAKKAGLRIAFYESEKSVAVTAGGLPRLPMGMRGAVIGFVREVMLRRDFEVGRAMTEVALVVGWEPRLTVVRARVQTAEIEVETDAGKLGSAVEQPQEALVPPPTPVVEAHPDNARCFVHLSVMLPAVPPPGATRLTRIVIPLELFVSGVTQKVELGPLGGKTQLEARMEGARISVLHAIDEEGIWRVQVRVEYEDGDAELPTESYENWFLRNPVRLVHRQTGETHPCNGGFNLIATGDRSFAVEYFFVDIPGKLGDYNLVYELPRRPEWVSAPLEFRDIPLPVLTR